MEIKLFSAQTSYEAAKLTLKQIVPGDTEFQNLVVVPDAFSMQAESLIFDTLQIKSTFNIQVVGISRLASKILQDANITFSRVSNLEEVFCTYKAVEESKEEFEYFKSSGVEFCQQILKVLKQFKACRILPKDIKATGDENLDKKMHDLKLIYEKYEAILGEKLDLSRFLDFFLKNTENLENLSKIRLYFINFDSFSAEIGNFIVSLASKVNATYIGMARPKKTQKNAFIYEDDIRKKIVEFAKKYDVVVPVEENFNTLGKIQREIAENLFGLDVKQGKESDFFFNIISKNRQEETEFVAKMIKRQVANGKRFKDFAIAVADEKHFKNIKQNFAKYGIVAYCDDAQPLSETVLGQFLQKILEISKRDFVLQDFEFFATSFLLGRDEAVLSEVQNQQIDNGQEFVQAFPKYEKIVFAINQLKNAKFLKDFAKQIKQILEIIKPEFENFLKSIEDENYFKSHSENAQSWELICAVLEKLSNLGGDLKLDLASFETLFVFSLRSVKVETIPTYIDAVYVGLATESYFADVDTLFVLGANAGAMPAFQADDGIIDDGDIKKLRLNFALEPEIRVLNRRKRLKFFELLQHAKNTLIVGSTMNDGGAHQEPADFVNDLSTLFGDKNTIRVQAFETFGLPVFSEEEELERLLFEIGFRENLMPTYTKLKGKIPKRLELLLEKSIKDVLPEEKKAEFLQNHHFPYKKTISASELECFFDCPFKHFLRYGMKLTEKKNILPTKANFGNFQHELLRRFVAENDVKNISKDDLEKFLEDNFDEIAKKYYSEKILKQNFFVKYLKSESKLILTNVAFEQKHSQFRPKTDFLEKEILYPLDDDVFLKGFVDRVDFCGNRFRILDYKTGQTGTVRTELFYGKKLQLFLYSLAIKEALGLDCAGVYYFDCQTKYSKNGSQGKLFKGITLEDEDVVLEMDDNLSDPAAKSAILGMSLKKTAKKDEFHFKGGDTEKSFNNLTAYALDISKQAVKELKSGLVAEKPFGDACQMCPYFSICRHSKLDGKRTTLKERKSKEKEAEDGQD